MTETFVDHDLQGIAVGVKPKIFRDAIVDRYVWCSEGQAFDAQCKFARDHGIFPGNSSGANLHAAYMIEREYGVANVHIFSLIYDTGDAYIKSI